MKIKNITTLLTLSLAVGFQNQASAQNKKPSNKAPTTSSSTSSSSSTSVSGSDFFAKPSETRGYFQHEVTTGLSAMGIAGGSGAVLDVGKGGTAFNLSGGYYHSLSSFIQVGGSAGLVVLGGATVFTLIPGAKFNFGPSMEEAYFAAPSLGLLAGDASGFIFDVSFGKRFKLFENVYFTPDAGLYVMRSSGTTLTRFRINAVKFSVAF